LPVSDTIVSTIRSELSITHFWARFSSCARASNPSASQPGCAARARATSSGTCSGATASTLATICPVAGFSTSIFWVVGGASVMAMCEP
jgi:hypothetical protein